MERINRFRGVLLLVLFGFILTLFAGKLFMLQIVETDGNNDNTQTYTTITTVRAARGDILDRNGNVLVGNRASYDLVFNHYVAKSYSDTNNALHRLTQKCDELGIVYNDHFPITKTPPFEYTLQEFKTSWQNHFQTYMVDSSTDPDITAPLLMEKLRERYKIPETWSDQEARAVIGIRYEFDLRGITNLPNYTFLEDVSDEHLSILLELNTPGLMVESSTVREYHTQYGAHVLGYLGGMDNSQWETYKSQGYSMDALVGQTGFEQAFEEYLHGIDGQRVDIVSKDGAIINQFWREGKDEAGNPITYAPVAGNNVETTLDINLQKVTEDALAEIVGYLQDPDVNKSEDARDVQGAAAVVMDVKTGEILACASYPTFNLATMHEDWADIEADPRKPFFNRAFGAEYPPGSTFKMSTLITAMENRNKEGQLLYSPGELIRDTGFYDNPNMAGFHPTCLIYSSNPGVTHGELDAVRAIAVSCNVFFYELGYRATWQMQEATCKALGMGVPTGIELVEKTGRLNNPDTKREVYGPGINGNFSGGDRVLGAIGQAETRVTPLQLCVYASTLANKGTRMKATFLSRVVSSDYKELIYENTPQIASQLEMQWTTIDTYYQGMRECVTYAGVYTGTGSSFFGGPKDFAEGPGGRWPLAGEIEVYAKTGTAQHSSGGSDHGAFICFAKRKDAAEPDVAISIYGEKAAHGNWLCPIAEKILIAYYDMVEESEVTAFENQAG